MHQQQTAFENIVGKEEIAHNQQFLLFPQCLLLNQKIVSSFLNIYGITSSFAAELKELKIGIRGKVLNYLREKQIMLENIVGKGDSTGNKLFLIFLLLFLLFQRRIPTFEIEQHLICSQMVSTKPESLSSGNRLRETSNQNIYFGQREKRTL